MHDEDRQDEGPDARLVNVWAKLRQMRWLFALAMLALACGTSQTQSGGRSATLDPAALVSVCVSNHHLTAATDSQNALGAPPVRFTTTFRNCAWPPPAYAAQDGYSEIVVSEYAWESHPEVTGASAPDLVRSTCAEVELAYTFQKQGPPSPATVQAASGAVVDVFGKPWANEPLPFAHAATDVVIVHNLSYTLERARCLR